jgi:hypothetical protein
MRRIGAGRMDQVYSFIDRNIGPLLDKIASDAGLDTYKYLLEGVRNTAIIRGELFQSRYRSYWQMGAARLAPDFCKAYFECLEELKTAGAADIERIARRLYDVPANSKGEHKLHFSFSTKMAHMLQPALPVYDRFVAQFFFLPDGGGTFDAKLRSRLASYNFLMAEYRRVLKEELLGSAIDAFRRRFAIAESFTDTKIIDTLIWQFVALLNAGGLVSGTVKYV